MGSKEQEAVTSFVDRLVELHGVLESLEDLRPCQSVNELFGELVGLCTQTLSTSVTNEILRHPSIREIVPSLRRLCSIAECHLESYWATRMTSSGQSGDAGDAYERLKAFPYYDNYVDLTRMELSAIASVTPPSQGPPQRIAFIGSGPLPLTSLCLCEELSKRQSSKHQTSYHLSQASQEVEVLNIDHYAPAISQSRALSHSLGHRAKGMTFLHQSASSALDLRRFDVVYLAALVGLGQSEKEGILEEVVGGMREGALVVIRTAWGLRGSLYPEFDATTGRVLGCLEICLAVHPFGHIVNSVVVGRVRGRRKGARL